MSKYHAGLPVDLLRSAATKLKGRGPFRRSPRLRQLFDYLFEETINGTAEKLSQYNIAYDCFKFEGTFDAGQNSLIRTHVMRLRKALSNYITKEGSADEIHIQLADEGYRMVFSQPGFIQAKTEFVENKPIVALCRFACAELVSEQIDLSTVLTDELATALDSIGQWRILGPLDKLPTDGSEKEKLKYIRSFGAVVLLEGSVYAQPEKVVILFRLRCLKTEIQIWSHRYESSDVGSTILEELNLLCTQLCQYLGTEHGVISNHIGILASLNPHHSQSTFELMTLCWSAMRDLNFSNSFSIVKSLQKATKDNPNEPILLASLATFLVLIGTQPQYSEKFDLEFIEKLVSKAILLASEETWTLIARAFYYAAKGDKIALQDLASEVKRLEIKNQTLFGSLGVCMCLQNVSPDQGLGFIREATSYNPDYPKAFHVASSVYFASHLQFEPMLHELNQLPTAPYFPRYRGTGEVDRESFQSYPRGAWAFPFLMAFYHAHREEVEETQYYWGVMELLNDGSASKALEIARRLWADELVDQFSEAIFSLLHIKHIESPHKSER